MRFLVLLLTSLFFSPSVSTAADKTIPETAVTQAAPTVQPKLGVSNIGGKIHYIGVVADEKTRGSILASLKKVFGEGNISGYLDISPNAGPANWLECAPALCRVKLEPESGIEPAFEKLKIPGVAALFQGNSISLGGPLPKADLDATKASLQSIFGSGFTFGAMSDADRETAPRQLK